jgi:hypothetical protein
MTAYYQLDKATYLDLDSYFNNALSDGGTPTGSHEADGVLMNVALVLDRAAPEQQLEALLGSNWASRQKLLAEMGPAQVAATFGANLADYQTVINDLAGMHLQTVEQAAGQQPTGYISSAASRTIWVQVDAAGFNALFNTKLLQQDPESGGKYYWAGSLSLPQAWQGIVQGIWFDVNDATFGPVPPTSGGTEHALSDGFQGTGNGVGKPHETQQTPQTIAGYYNLPLVDQSVQTDAIALLESNLGDVSPDDHTFEHLLDEYRSSIGLPKGVTVIGVEPGGARDSASSERSLDVGVATAINPNSTLILYAGSGVNAGAKSEPFTTYQAAIWDTVNNPSVVSSSDRFVVSQPSPESPFWWAAQQLFVDAALRNITVVSSSGDGGSGYETANGDTNVTYTRSSPYGIVVGGTSVSLGKVAADDPTLTTANGSGAYTAIYTEAVEDKNPQVLWSLVAGGMTTMPKADDPNWFIETVWNRYQFDSEHNSLDPGYQSNESGNGGIDPTQSTPWFQSALSPFFPFETTDRTHATGRGVPDVAALAGGNMYYTVPTEDMKNTHGDGGTSGATPLWASLIVQLNAIFEDQGLPDLGYMTDLLYVAAAVAPASFNDVSVGDNISSFLLGGDHYKSDGEHIIPTGYGYLATTGYDLASGLGSPNGVVLARALTAIAQSQWSYDSVAKVLVADGSGGWQSGASQSLLLQSITYDGPMAVALDAGAGSVQFDSAATAELAWTPRFAGQVLQSSFDPELVMLFDHQSQGALGQTTVINGAELSVTLDDQDALAWGSELTNRFGFVDFQSSATTALRVARPVAIAEIPGGPGHDNTLDAVVRVRQSGIDDVAITFYRVDNLSGGIGSYSPGDAGYAAQAQARAYQLASGGTLLDGPGYGKFVQTELLNVGAGAFIAMTLQNQTTGNTFWGFASANETVDGVAVAHLWNYGLNIWGFEDQYGGGDTDYNDVTVQLDFTSAAGHQWLVF